ncbi:MAG: hypothetical protein ACRC2T_12700 [Thermoguttaceae bacterium]
MPRRQVAGGGTLHAKLLMPERQVPAHTGLRYNKRTSSTFCGLVSLRLEKSGVNLEKAKC